MTDVTIFFKGYNSITQGYNEGGYETDVAFTGLSLGQGTVVPLAGTIVPVTESEITSAVGSVTVVEGTGVTVSVTSAEMTASTATINIWEPIIPDQTTDWPAVDTSQTPNWTEIAA